MSDDALASSGQSRDDVLTSSGRSRDVDDEIKETKATRFHKVLDKLELIEKAVNKLHEEKPKQVKKLMDKDFDIYKNKRNVYVNKLNNKDIKFPKKETLEYYEIKFDDQERAY